VDSPGVSASPLPGKPATDTLLAGNAASASRIHRGTSSFVFAARAAVHGGAPSTTTSAAPKATLTTALRPERSQCVIIFLVFIAHLPGICSPAFAAIPFVPILSTGGPRDFNVTRSAAALIAP
jgi:hypothetical protein